MSDFRDITVTSLLERLEELNSALTGCSDDCAAITGKLYTDTLDVIKDIKKQNQEITLAKLASGCNIEIAEDATLTSLLERLEDLGNALTDVSDTRAEITGKLYSETLNVIKDIAKQNQEVTLAQIKAAK